MPNFNAVYGMEAPPLSGGQKFRLAFRGAVDPFAFAEQAVLSLYGQATDSHQSYDKVKNAASGSYTVTQEGYGQGLKGYAKRYGANYADSFDGAILGNALFPALLHEDARYFRMGETHTIKQRIVYAAGTSFWTRTDKGHPVFNFANILGNLAAGGISNLYYPPDDRGAALTFEGAATVTAEGIFGAMILEFYPDLERVYLRHKHRHGTSATDPHALPPAAPPTTSLTPAITPPKP